MQVRDNEGIIQTGGTMTAKNIAAGTQAQAGDHVGSDMQQRALSQLQEFRDALDANADKLEADLVHEARDAVDLVEKELKSKKPNKLAVKSIIKGLADNIRSVTGLATSLDALAKSIHRLF